MAIDRFLYSIRLKQVIGHYQMMHQNEKLWQNKKSQNNAAPLGLKPPNVIRALWPPHFLRGLGTKILNDIMLHLLRARLYFMEIPPRSLPWAERMGVTNDIFLQVND